MTTTTVTVNVSTAKEDQGQFKSASTSTTTREYDSVTGKTTVTGKTDPTGLNFGQAVKAIGATNMAAAIDKAIPGVMSRLGPTFAHDYTNHPGLYLGHHLSTLGAVSGGPAGALTVIGTYGGIVYDELKHPKNYTGD